jgi:hypothetical protein
MLGNFGGYVALGFTIIWFIGMLIWFFRRRYGKTKKVTATVISTIIIEVTFFRKFLLA